MSEIIINPQTFFITEPFIKCPKCGNNSFGILMICSKHYNRRCKICAYPNGQEYLYAAYPLPDLNKKIIYLDQFVISNIMKAIKGMLSSNSEYWEILFERLDSLYKFELIACPSSIAHINESLASKNFSLLKEMYEVWSCGVSFYDFETIKRNQILDYASKWITGMDNIQTDFNIRKVTNGDVNNWQGKFNITLNLNFEQKDIDSIINIRDQIHEQTKIIFQRWKTENDKEFDYWYEQESKSFGYVTLDMFKEKINRKMNNILENREIALEDFFYLIVKI